MNEVPVFVPHGRDRLAAVIALPDREPRGCVVFATGVGAPRSHRFRVWSRTAQRLTEIGIASIRWDYLGLHDSTGEAPVVLWSEDIVEQALAIAAFARRAVGVDGIAAAGNCLGARIALRLAADTSGAVGAICMLPPILERRWIHRQLRQVVGTSAPAGVLGSRPHAAPVVRRLKHLGVKTDPTMGTPLRRALRHGRLLFLFGDEDLLERRAAAERLEKVIRRLPREAASRCEIRTLPGGTLVRLASVQIQQRTIETVVAWMDLRFSEAAMDPLAGTISTP